MITMNMSLYNLYANGYISEEVALEFSDDRNELIQMIKGVYSGAQVIESEDDEF